MEPEWTHIVLNPPGLLGPEHLGIFQCCDLDFAVKVGELFQAHCWHVLVVTNAPVVPAGPARERGRHYVDTYYPQYSSIHAPQ